MKFKFYGVVLLFIAGLPAAHALTLKKVIENDLAPKSVVHSGNGLFVAQNMMYRHKISVFNRKFELVKDISDKVDLSSFGYKQYKGLFHGAPVEASFSHGGKFAWISNYEMSGEGFTNPGHDKCTLEEKTDHSFVYKINTETLRIENVIKVGSVPKYVAATPDSRYVLVSNWCTYDVTVIDTATDKVIKTVPVGRFPRGLAPTSTSDKVYIAVMGSFDIAVLDMKSFEISWIQGVGRSPRHLVLSPDDKYLYATLNGENLVAKIDTEKQEVVTKVSTGERPRSMVASDDGKYLYVVNYFSNTVSKVDAATMTVLESVEVNPRPIGITYDPQTRQVWVACYSGFLMVFQDEELPQKTAAQPVSASPR